MKYETDNGKVETLFEGLNWLYKNGKHSLSVICHNGSYGRQKGLFEVQASWEEDVIGFLSFGEVQKYINKLMKLKRDN